MEKHGVPNSGRARAASQPRAGGSYPGHEFLRQGSPREVLARIVEGDPLDVRGRCIARLRSRALLVSLERLVLRSMARAARAAMGYRGQPPLGEWFEARIDDSIADLVREDREYERMGPGCTELGCTEPGRTGPGHTELGPREPLDPHYAFVSDALGVDPALARRVCVVYNDLPDLQRQAFWAVVVEGKSIHRYVAEGHGPPDHIRQALVEAFRAVSQLNDDDIQGEV